MEWFQTYTRIAFQLHAALEAHEGMYFVDTYYGPDAWRTDAPPQNMAQTVVELDGLRDSIDALFDSAARAAFLRANLTALETLCRYLMGEPMTLREAARGMLDITPVPVPEATLEDYRRKAEQALGGRGTLAQRYARFHARSQIQSADNAALQRLYERALAEARTRTRAILPLPDDERVNVSVISNVFYGAANWYRGNYQSVMELNADRPATLLRLLMLACHEGYPGHHTESVLKEKHLYHDKGYTEQSLFFNGPQVVIAEGIATLAAAMIFPPDEAAAWITEQYRALGQPLEEVDLPLLLEAFWSLDPDAMGTNVLLRLEEGASLNDTIAYALRYALNTEEEERRFLTELANASLMRRVYQFSYYHGRHLMEPLLQGENRLDVWRALLTQQLTPAMLRTRGGEKQLL